MLSQQVMRLGFTSDHHPPKRPLLFQLLIRLWRDVCCIGSPAASEVCVFLFTDGGRGGEVWARSTVRSGLVISPRTTSFLLLVVVQTQTRYGSTTLDTTNTRRLCYSLHCTYGTWRAIDFRYIYTYCRANFHTHSHSYLRTLFETRNYEQTLAWFINVWTLLL